MTPEIDPLGAMGLQGQKVGNGDPGSIEHWHATAHFTHFTVVQVITWDG